MHSPRNQSIHWTALQHIAALGEPLLELQPSEAEQIVLSVGGDVANFMLCLGRILRGSPPNLSIVSALGNSAYSSWLRNRIEQEGVHLVETRIPGEPGIYGISPDRTQQLPFSYWRLHSAAHRFFQSATLKEFDELIPQPDLLVVTGITLSLCSSESFAALLHWIDANRRKCSIVFDVNYRPALWASVNLARQRISELERRASLVATGVEDELKLWSIRGANAVMERLRDCSIEYLVRAAKDGCWVGSENHWDRVPTVAVTVVDPAGAGDAHLAGYVGARMRGASSLDAATFANNVAAVIVKHAGSAPSKHVVFPPLPHPSTLE